MLSFFSVSDECDVEKVISVFLGRSFDYLNRAKRFSDIVNENERKKIERE